MRKLTLALLAAGVTYAASLTGNVYDPDGAVIPKVRVTLTDSQTGKQVSTETGAAGEYAFSALVAGRYQLQAAAPGFAMGTRGGIALDANTARTENFILRLGEIQETVEVRATGTPSAQAPAPRRIRVGGNVQATKLLRQPRAAYPEKALAEGREGRVLLKAVIGKDGYIGSLVTMTGADPDLAAAAVEAVRQWQYQPTLLNGQPVEVATTVEVNFRLSR
jgi:TonB family protein